VGLASFVHDEGENRSNLIKIEFVLIGKMI